MEKTARARKAETPRLSPSALRPLVMSLLLAVIVAAVYWPVAGYEFVYDDEFFVVNNPHLQRGLNLEDFKEYFTGFYGANWNPVTWLSHLLDIRMFGMNPGGHHFVNVLFHAANTVLLFLILQGMTGAAGKSAFTAALFAVHPLHVESVAWVAERRDVLSTFLGFLVLGVYVSHARRASARSYLLIIFTYLLGLMSKPMLVTWPFVLLLLDYWPLGRYRGVREKRFASLVVEKTPLFALSVASACITYLAQERGGAVNMMEHHVWLRMSNAVTSYLQYLVKTFWPSNLGVFYPFPVDPPLQRHVIASFAILSGISLAAFIWRRRSPSLLVGWCWYLGTLVPVIGLVPVGGQSMADRFTYIPLVGVFMMLVWGIPRLAILKKVRLSLPVAAASTIVVALMVLSFRQVGYWRDDITLFTRDLQVTSRNWVAHYNLGAAHQRNGDFEKAIDNYRQALLLDPYLEKPRLNLGSALMSKGRIAEAVTQFKDLLRINPSHTSAHVGLGAALSAQGKREEALAHYRTALSQDPGSVDAHLGMGSVLASAGRTRDAADHYSRALALRPDSEKAHNNLGVAFAHLGRIDAAIEHYREALRIRPDYFNAHANLGAVLLRKGQLDEALIHAREAVRIRPQNVDARASLEIVLSAMKK